MKLKEKVELLISQFGFPGMCRNVFGRVCRTFGVDYRQYYLLEKNLSEGNICPSEHLPEGFEVKRLEYEDYCREKEAFGLTEPKLMFLKYLLEEYGAYEGYGVFHNGRMVYKCGIELGRLSVPGNFSGIPLGESDVVFVEDYCVPSMRKRRINSYMNVFRQNRAVSLGKKRAFSAILTYNVPSLRTFLNNGFHIAFKYSFFKFDIHFHRSTFKSISSPTGCTSGA